MTETKSLSIVPLRGISYFCTKGFLTASYPWLPQVSVRGGSTVILNLSVTLVKPLEAHFQGMQQKRSHLLRLGDHTFNIR